MNYGLVPVFRFIDQTSGAVFTIYADFSISTFDGHAIRSILAIQTDRTIFAVDYHSGAVFAVHSDGTVFAVCSSFAHGYIVRRDCFVHFHRNGSLTAAILGYFCSQVVCTVFMICFCLRSDYIHLTSQFIGHYIPAVGSKFQALIGQCCRCIVDRILKVPDVGCIFQRIAGGILQWSSTKTAGYIGQLGTISTAFQSNLTLVYRTVCILVILHSPVIQFLHITCTGNVFDCNRLNSCIRMISIFDFQVYLIIGHLIFTVAACFRIGNQAVVRLSCRCAGKRIIQFLQLVFCCRSSAYCSRIGDIPVFVVKAGDVALPGSIFAHDSCPRSNTVQSGHCLC